MILEEFVKQWDGKPCEVAGSADAKNQCVDLANAYIRDVWGLPIVEWTNAVDFPEKITNCNFIENTPDGVPQASDIVVFKKYGSLYGVNGHIGVVTEATANSMKIFEQNYPTGSLCKIGTHNYLGCRGWLRKKETMFDDEMVIKKLEYKNLFEGNQLFQQFKDNGYASVADVKADIAARNKTIEEQKAEIKLANDAAAEDKNSYQALRDAAAKALGVTQDVNQINAALTKLEKDLNDYDTVKRNLATLQTAFDTSVGNSTATIKAYEALMKNAYSPAELAKLPAAKRSELMWQLMVSLIKDIKVSLPKLKRR